MKGWQIVESWDVVENRRRADAAAIRQWLVLKVREGHGGSIPSHIGDGPHDPPRSLLLSYEGAADELAVSESTVKRLVRNGDLPTVSVGGVPRVRRSDLEQFVANLERRATA